jgi:hypothetical protein
LATGCFGRGNSPLKSVISASRRTDLVASFPDWLAEAVRARQATVLGPSGGSCKVDLDPALVHTFVLWSKDFSHWLDNAYDLRDLLAGYDQVYAHFTVTGLGGTPIEPGTIPYREALGQLPGLVAAVGDPRRVSVRFDPVVCWDEGGTVRSNLSLFPAVAEAVARWGIRDIRMSFAQWYGKARRRAASRRFPFVDPPDEEKRARATEMAAVAADHGLVLHACCQPALAGIAGLRPSACIDGAQLESLHPSREPAARRKDRGQRASCLCTESKDIGSYGQSCGHQCVYCYANPSK